MKTKKFLAQTTIVLICLTILLVPALCGGLTLVKFKRQWEMAVADGRTAVAMVKYLLEPEWPQPQPTSGSGFTQNTNPPPSIGVNDAEILRGQTNT